MGNQPALIGFNKNMKKNWETYQEKLILKRATPYLLLYAIFVFILLVCLIVLVLGQSTPQTANKCLETIVEAHRHLPINPTKPYKTITATITAYTPEVSQTDDTPLITANGSPVAIGGIACPRKISFGTLIEILGNRYVCNDRTALKYDDRFDIFFWNKNLAKSFGKKIAEVKIYE